MHFVTRIAAPCALIAASLSLGACDTILGPGDPTTIELEATRVALGLVGDTVRVSATVKSDKGKVLEDATVTWESRTGTVASVSGEGVVTATGNGAAWIVARSGAAMDSIQFTVNSPVDCAVVGDLAVPDTVTGQLANSGCALDGYNIDNWKLTVSAEMEMTIQLESSQFDAYLFLFNDNGQRLAEDDDGAGSFNSRIITTLSPGEYFVFATTYGPGETGAYELSAIEGLPKSPCPATATVSLPDTVTGTISAETACDYSGFYLDVWRLDIPEDSTILTLHVSSDDFQPAVIVADTIGAFLGGTANGPGSSALFQGRFPAGSYDVWLGSAFNEAETGSYTLAVRLGLEAVTCDAAGTVALGDVVTGTLTVDDCFPFGVTADAWEIELADTTELEMNLASDDFVQALIVTDSTGGVIHDFLPEGPSETQVAGVATLGPGAYRIWAATLDGGLGDYTIGVSNAGELPTCDPDGAIALGDSVDGSLATTDCQLQSGRYADVWTLTLDTVTTVDVTLDSDKFDAFLTIADSAGSKLAEDDDSGGGGNAALTLELEAGTYQLWASSYAAEAVGGYTLGAVTASAAALARTSPSVSEDKRSPATPGVWTGRSGGTPAWYGAWRVSGMESASSEPPAWDGRLRPVMLPWIQPDPGESRAKGEGGPPWR